MMVIKCYICDSVTDDWRSSLNGLKSQHSNTLIIDLIKNVLDDFKSMRNIDDESNCVCIDCLGKIEDYDWTYMQAKKSQQELYDLLIRTEKAWMEQEPEIDLNIIVSNPIAVQEPEFTMKMENDVMWIDDNASEPFTISADTQSIIEPQTNTTNQLFGEEISDNDAELNGEIEKDSSCERIAEKEEKFIVPAKISTLFDTRSPDFVCVRPQNGQKTELNIKRSVGRPRIRPKPESNIKRSVGRPRIRPKPKSNIKRSVGRPKKTSETDSNIKRSVGRPRKTSEVKQDCKTVLKKRSDNVCTTKQDSEIDSMEMVNDDVTSTDDRPIQQSNNTSPRTPSMDEPETIASVDEQINDDNDPDFNVEMESDSSDEDVPDQNDEEFLPSNTRGKRKAVRDSPKTDSKKNKRSAGQPKIGPKRNYECIECEKVFKDLKEWNAHRRWHRDQEFPKFKCRKCFYLTENQETFDAHAKLHDSVPPLQCVFCGFNARTKTKLNTHTQCHTSIPEHQCELCGKQFKRPITLKIHMNYHLNIRTKQCPHCPMTFVERKNLKRHLKSHTQIKPYACSTCGRRFAHRYNVGPHERSHTDPNVYRKFKCNFCKSGFDSKVKLNQHLQKIHSMATPHSEIANDLNDIVSHTTGTTDQRAHVNKVDAEKATNN